MTSVFDDFIVQVPCDKCRDEFEETMARLKTSPNLTCPNCGHTISVDGSKINEGLELFEEWRKNLSALANI